MFGIDPKSKKGSKLLRIFSDHTSDPHEFGDLPMFLRRIWTLGFRGQRIQAAVATAAMLLAHRLPIFPAR